MGCHGMAVRGDGLTSGRITERNVSEKGRGCGRGTGDTSPPSSSLCLKAPHNAASRERQCPSPWHQQPDAESQATWGGWQELWEATRWSLTSLGALFSVLMDTHLPGLSSRDPVD